ncbi:MAG: hypothetical protein ACE5JI_13090 [Acidobacteriota bacterium]
MIIGLKILEGQVRSTRQLIRFTEKVRRLERIEAKAKEEEEVIRAQAVLVQLNWLATNTEPECSRS